MDTTLRSAAVLAAAVLAAGCNRAGPGASGDGGEMTIVVSSNAHLEQKEKQLATQRANLETEQQRLLEARTRLITQLKGGGDTKNLVKLQQTLLDRERRLAEAQDQLDKERQKVATEKDALLGADRPKDPEAALEAREAAVARREADVSAREKDVARREKAVAQREARLAEREQAFEVRESLPALVAPSSEAPGRRVSRAQAQDARRALEQVMDSRGILPSDLPPDVAASYRRLYLLIRKRRYGDAVDDANRLETDIAGIQVDEKFIQQKMARLNALRAGKKLSKTQSKEVQGLLAQATSAFADGRQASANLDLNRMFAILGQ